MKKAVTAGDLARYRLDYHERKVASALALIEQAAAYGKIGAAYSSGKDSTVVLDLVRRVIPDAPAGFFDSGEETEYRQNYALVDKLGVQRVPSEISLADMCRYGGYWGYEKPVEPNAEFDFMAFLVRDPAMRFALDTGVTVMAMGLRAEESSGRRLNYRKRGKFYEVNRPPVTHHLCPIADWRVDDVFAYIAGRGLDYNPIYDLLAETDLPRKEWRISVLLGTSASGLGRYAALRLVAPDKWNYLCREFPALARRFT